MIINIIFIRGEEMPFIEFKSNRKISDEQQVILREAIGRILEIIPGETREFTVYTFMDELRINFGLENPDQPCVYVSVEVFDKIMETVDKNILQTFLRGAKEIVYNVLQMPPENTFVYFTTLPMMAWDEKNIVG